MKWKTTREKKKKQEASEDLWLNFKQWWQPHSFDAKTGAEVGGHPEALRVCVNHQGNHKPFGIPAEEAFNCQRYRDEYRQWLKDGQPERVPEATGNCVSRRKAAEGVAEVRAIMGGDPF